MSKLGLYDADSHSSTLLFRGFEMFVAVVSLAAMAFALF